ncbi:biopolymer transporter ExbD [Prevotella sp. E2-28]|uniref:ExbD/TolR family protein n=1 Tax=Prevotella sp. E2-28 TaxID=2913620 RepID=UPI001EDBBEBA|nr:biopolymer transporter ExbD [Prevotella sp. E2-28]UKK53488.1 biopolymer transporter ExbD [Prevotella sp. E2-28]
MGKIKIKKNDVWIDMTPMSDVMVLLLTFFMLSVNFTKNEVVKVITPGSTTKAKVSSSAVLDITIDPEGRVLMSTDKTVTMQKALEQMLKDRETNLSAEQKQEIINFNQIGIPVKSMPEFLSKSHEDQVKLMKVTGIPTDSLQNREDKMSEFQLWVKAMKNGYKEWYNDLSDAEKTEVSATKLEINIKADKETPYGAVKLVIAELQDINESRYKLVTQAKKLEE